MIAKKLQDLQNALNRAFARQFREVNARSNEHEDRTDKTEDRITELEKINEDNNRC